MLGSHMSKKTIMNSTIISIEAGWSGHSMISAYTSFNRPSQIWTSIWPEWLKCFAAYSALSFVKILNEPRKSTRKIANLKKRIQDHSKLV